jgi:hypothetical protein
MEPDYPALALLVRMAATAAFVLAMGWLVARARPALAAVAIAMPVVIGPGFLMLALERDAAFVMRAAEDALGALAGTVAFAVAVALWAGRLAPALVLAAALGAWLATVAAAGLATGWAGNGAAFVLAYGLGLAALRGAPPAGRGGALWSPGAESLRALAAGGLVGAVTLAAGWLGPGLSGTLIALPVGMLFVAAGVLRMGGPGRARQVMAAGARGTAALALFLVVLRGALAAGAPPLPAVLAATVAGVAMALALGLAVRAGAPASDGPGA